MEAMSDRMCCIQINDQIKMTTVKVYAPTKEKPVDEKDIFDEQTDVVCSKIKNNCCGRPQL